MRYASTFLVLSVVLSGAVGVSPVSAGNGSLCNAPPPSLDEVLGITTVAGALVIKVLPGSAAEGQGIAVGDMLETANGKSLRELGSLEQFSSRLREAAMLSHASLTLWKYDAVSGSYTPSALELRIPAEVGARAGIAIKSQILVLEVHDGGPAALAGLEAGYFIESIDGERVAILESPLLMDIRITDAASSIGEVRLRVGRWEPLPDSREQKMALRFMREVTVAVRSAGG